MPPRETVAFLSRHLHWSRRTRALISERRPFCGSAGTGGRCHGVRSCRRRGVRTFACAVLSSSPRERAAEALAHVRGWFCPRGGRVTERAREERAAVAAADATRSRMAGCARERVCRGRPRRRTGGSRAAGRSGAGLRRGKRRGVARGADEGGRSSGARRPRGATATTRTSARSGPAVRAVTTHETIIAQCIVTLVITLTEQHALPS